MAKNGLVSCESEVLHTLLSRLQAPLFEAIHQCSFHSIYSFLSFPQLQQCILT